MWAVLLNSTVYLQAIISGKLTSPWENRTERATVYFDDFDQQLDDIIKSLFRLMRTTPESRQPPDEVAFVFDVLWPEVKYVSTLSLLNILNCSNVTRTNIITSGSVSPGASSSH